VIDQGIHNLYLSQSRNNGAKDEIMRKLADQAERDTGKVSNNQLFWEGVQEAFKSQDESYDNMHFADDEILRALRDLKEFAC